MSDNYEKLTAAGAENCHPKFIAEVDGKREVVGEVVDGVVYLTDAGKKFLSEDVADESVTEFSANKPSRKSRKVVESANSEVGGEQAASE